ncbi:hypothetical protein DNTS_004193 [Danionella cerebrum]|uniref:Uncharacterized protein n=1 Tax=Danionella cerebrum TaxID=2873325 RepID=A0A553Q901_9TELE|nr:hypothetical protein DNTS_004193 [Danionella translucida]
MHSQAGPINDARASDPALLILKGRKDLEVQPKCLEQKVTRRTRNLPPSHLRVLRSSRRKVIRKEMTAKSKEDSRRERSSNFQAFVKLALETLLGSCRRKHGGPRGRQG